MPGQIKLRFALGSVKPLGSCGLSTEGMDVTWAEPAVTHQDVNICLTIHDVHGMLRLNSWELGVHGAKTKVRWTCTTYSSPTQPC